VRQPLPTVGDPPHVLANLHPAVVYQRQQNGGVLGQRRRRLGGLQVTEYTGLVFKLAKIVSQ
jgi:hypothetical protein